MDELIKALTAKVGIDEAVAEKAVGIILGFLRKEAPAAPVNALIEKFRVRMQPSHLQRAVVD